MPLNVIRKTTDSGSTWVRQFDTFFDVPSFSRFTFHAVSALATNNALIVGTTGQIRAFVASTTIYSSPNSGTTETLTGCCLATTTIGYVSGTNGTLLKTTDFNSSGGTWASSNTGITPSDTLIDVHFAPSQSSNGITLGWASDKSPVLYYTSDSGANWSSHILPSITNGRFTRVKMTSADTAYAAGYYLNGGSFMLKGTDLSSSPSWTMLTIPHIDRLRAIVFTTDNNGAIFGREGKIFQTSDGGSNWSLRSMPVTAPFFDFTCADTFNTTNYVAGGAAGHFVASTTSGGSWVLGVWNTRYYGKSIYGVGTTTATIGYAVGEDGTILTSTTATTTSQWASLSVAQTYNNLESASFISSTTGWMSGHGGRILKTSDGGTTWVDQSISDNLWCNSIRAVDDNNIFVSANFGAEGRVYQSSDGGSNWSQMSVPANTKFIMDLTAYDTSNVWACGQNGFIGYYDGITWVNQTSGSTDLLKSIHMIDSAGTKYGVCVGNNNTLLYTSNGGSTWSTVSTAGLTTADLGFVKVHMIDQTTAILTGSSRVWKVSNLNTSPTWITHQLCTESNLITCISFYDSNNGFIAGGKRMWKTSDGGTTWEEMNISHLEYGDAIGCIASYSADNVWIAYQSILLFEFD